MGVMIQQGKPTRVSEHLINCLSGTKRIACVSPGWLVWVKIDLPTVGQDDGSIDPPELGMKVGGFELMSVHFSRVRLVAGWWDNDVLADQVAASMDVDGFPQDGSLCQHHLLIALNHMGVRNLCFWGEP